MENLDKNKVEVLVDEVFDLDLKTPRGNLVRFVFPNKKEFMWKWNYIYELLKWGVWKIHSKEVDVDGENIMLLMVDKRKLKEIKKYAFVDSRKIIAPDLYWFDDKVFKFKIAGNKIGGLDFYSAKDGRNDMFHLMKAFVVELTKSGVRRAEWVTVQVKRTDMKKYIRGEFKMDSDLLSDSWFKSTKHNLKNKIPTIYKGYINIGDFNKNNQTYEFGLKVYL